MIPKNFKDVLIDIAKYAIGALLGFVSTLF